jgi:diguanylate cyclase (GGDEF)-like protein
VSDLHGASRAVAYLLLTSAPYIFVTGAILLKDQTVLGRVAVTVTSIALVAGGIFCWRRPKALPGYFWLIAPFVAVTFITGINLVTHDASTGAQLFFLWPVLYAAMYLPRRFVYAVLAVAFAGNGICVFLLLETAIASADLPAMILALSMSAVVVMILRERADKLLRVLETQALADPLTGLSNRRSFDRELAHAEVWLRRSGGPLALLSIDLDYFKAINDTWGHAVGDLTLQSVANAMRAVAGDTDTVARLGGDEFVMLLRAGRVDALRVAEELRTLVAAGTGVPGGPPGLSIGVAVLPADAETIEGLLAASDAALYEAKVCGRGRVSSADTPPSSAHDRRQPDLAADPGPEAEQADGRSSGAVRTSRRH